MQSIMKNTSQRHICPNCSQKVHESEMVNVYWPLVKRGFWVCKIHFAEGETTIYPFISKESTSETDTKAFFKLRII